MAVDKEASGGRQRERAKRASIQVTPREMRGMMMATKTSLELEEVTTEEKEEEARAVIEASKGLCSKSSGRFLI